MKLEPASIAIAFNLNSSDDGWVDFFSDLEFVLQCVFDALQPLRITNPEQIVNMRSEGRVAVLVLPDVNAVICLRGLKALPSVSVCLSST